MPIINTCNTKRPLPLFTLTPSKRPRFTFTAMPRRNNKNTQSVSFPSKSTVSRISLYPHAKPPLQREVHAPCKPTKFNFSPNSTRESVNFQTADNGNNCSSKILHINHQKARNAALSSTSSLNGSDVVEVDDVGLKDKAFTEEDSSLQEVHIVRDDDNDEPEGPSVLTHQKSRNTDDDVVVVTEIHDDFDSKVTDGGYPKLRASSVASELTTDNNNNLNVVDAGKMLSSLSLSPEHPFSSVRAYKKLIEAVDNQSRRHTFERLSYEIELNEKRREAFDLLRPKKALVEEEPREPFVPLTKEEKAEVARAFSAKRNEVLVTHEKSNIGILVNKFQCLKPREWLNDEVINLYLELLKEREIREPKKFLKCHFFNTFFYKKLIGGTNGYDFKSVRRWTSQKKLGYGLHECDKIFVPIHREVHWCLAVINKKDKKFQYLDSLKGMDTRVLKVLAKYFVDEVKDKTGEDIDLSSWEEEFVEDLPEQKNGYDCGVFMIKYTDFFSRNLGLCFNQKHMPYFRLRTAKEILRLKAD
ncbi:hypothetical protein RIF29_08045 [Crotalaria pallida]|uniref:Ubiquitin-like protease family profile domain-containing protein n=1 Tax=Crotalaria pallida TaxID=3830 RepID=A0AAN9J551_CROPI